MPNRSIFKQLWENRETLIVAAAVAGVIYFLDSIHETLIQTQLFDQAWAKKDDEQTATVIETIEDVKTVQAQILGRLEGSNDLIYQMGLRDGQLLCKSP